MRKMQQLYRVYNGLSCGADSSWMRREQMKARST